MSPRRPQERPKRRQEGPKTAPRAPQDGGRRRPTTNFSPSKADLAPKRPQEASGRPFRTSRDPKIDPRGTLLGVPPASIFKAPGSPFPPQVAQHLSYIFLDTWPGGMREAIESAVPPPAFGEVARRCVELYLLS